MNRRSFPIIAGLVFVSIANAFDPNADPESSDLSRGYVLVEAELIELSRETFSKIAGENPHSVDATELRNKLVALIETGDAVRTRHLNVNTRSGQRGRATSAKEVIYPTEADENGQPVAFEMREVGAMFEVDPVVGVDGSSIDVNFAFEVVEVHGETVTEFQHPDFEKPISLKMPIFYTREITTAASIPSLAYSFVGTVGATGDPDNESGKIGAVFLRATTGF